jgi:hypothetical protein
VLVVCIGLAVLVVALIALREPNGHVAAQQTGSQVSKQTTPAAPRTSPSKQSKPSSAGSSGAAAPRGGDSHGSTAAKSVPLIVLNNTTITGLAQRAAQRFENGGWTVTRYDNYQNDILSTCAYFDPAIAGAKAAAEALQQQYPTIKRVEPRFGELPDGPVVVVLTPDYSAG